MNNPLSRVRLPRLAAPNLIARLYMLCIASGTVKIAWLVPMSATAKIMASGGIIAQAVLAVMATMCVIGLIDILFNDALVFDKPSPALKRWCSFLESGRERRCHVISSCYLIQMFAGAGSDVTGTFWLLEFYLEVGLITCLLSWSLMFLRAAAYAPDHVSR